jgi:FKBP-type peptidyl-prolyl cis-trans isomerase
MLRTILIAALCSTTMLTGCLAERGDKPKAGDPVTLSKDDPFAKYLPWDEKNPAVKSTGVQYISVKEGPASGKSPGPKDRVRVHYEGRRTNGMVFDSSYERGEPAEFRLNQVIPGWTLGLQKMTTGDEYMFYIPSALAYGDNPQGAVIQPGDDLVFRVELLEIIEPVLSKADAWTKYKTWPKTDKAVQKTGTGVEYIVLASGDAKAATPQEGDGIVVYYEGRVAGSDQAFDSTFATGDPATLPAKGLMPGWDEALSKMRPGDHWLVYIPSNLGFGATEQGMIPANSNIMFEVKLQEILKVPVPDEGLE